MAESHSYCSPVYLHWIPKINHDLYDSIDKVIRDTVDGDPLLFIPRPTWKVIGREGDDDFMLVNVSNVHQINIFMIYRYEMNYQIVDHIDISENWWIRGQTYSRRVAIVNPSDYNVKWINNIYTKNYPKEIRMSIDRVTEVLLKFGLVEWRNTKN